MDSDVCFFLVCVLCFVGKNRKEIKICFLVLLEKQRISRKVFNMSPNPCESFSGLLILMCSFLEVTGVEG